MPGAGAVHVTFEGPCCLQTDGGRSPLASGLLLASISAFISALGGLGFDDIDGMAVPWVRGPEPPLTRAQVPRPGGGSGRSAVRLVGASPTCAQMIAASRSVPNGTRPVRHSYSTQPSEYWSARPSTDMPRICSGAT